MESIDGKRKAAGKDLRVGCCCCLVYQGCAAVDGQAASLSSLSALRLRLCLVLQVQTLLAQEASKRQCIDGILPQEQQPPAQDFLQQQDNSNAS